MRRFSPVIQTTMVQFVVLGLGLVNSILLARLLGPTGRGEWAAALLWPQALVYLSSFGIQDACVYYAARLNADIHRILANALIAFLVQMAIILPLSYFLLAPLLARQSQAVLAASRFLLVTMALGLFSLYGTSVLRGKLNIALFNALSLIIPVGSLAATVGLVLAKRLSLHTLVLAYTVICLILALATLIALVKEGAWRGFRPDKKIMADMWRYGIRVHLGSISQMANLRLDQMLMAALLPANQLGLYVAAVSAASVTGIMPSAVRTVIAPTIAQENPASQDMGQLEKRLRMYWSINIVIGLLLLAFIPFGILVVFGPEFRASIWVAEILVLAAIFLGEKDMLSGASYGLGTPFLVSQAELVSVIVTVAALAFLLPWLGIVGAGLASLLAYSSSLFFLLWRLHRTHGLSARRVLIPQRQEVVALIERGWRALVRSVRRTAHASGDQAL